MATYPHQGPAPYARYEGAPRPLGEVIRDLPRQYMQVLTRPSAATFAAELGKAEWRSVWFQLLSWINFAIFIYGIVLQVFAIMAAHRLSGGKATAAVFLPGLVIALFITVFAFVFAGALIGALLS